MNKTTIFFTALAVLLSDVMCALVGYNYGKMVMGAGYSAPAWTAFLWAIPFLMGIVLCIIAAVAANKRR